jgi:hypothetical protein
MMDLMILLAVFVAILALAYFTYRNVVGLDMRLRKIEDVLRNAEVVAEPRHPTERPEMSEAPVPGWGGEGGPSVIVEREQAEVIVDDEAEADVDAESEAESEVGADDDMSVNEILNSMEKSSTVSTTMRNATVSAIRDALKKANVSFPSNAKKAELLEIVKEHNVELSA